MICILYSQHLHPFQLFSLVHFVLPSFLSTQTCRCQGMSVFQFQFCRCTLGRACKRVTSMLPHIIQICKFEWKCAGCSVLQLCLSVQIENIDACLSFLAAKGVNIQGLSAEGKLVCCTLPFTGISWVDTNLGLAKQKSFLLWKKIKNGSLMDRVIYIGRIATTHYINASTHFTGANYTMMYIDLMYQKADNSTICFGHNLFCHIQFYRECTMTLPYRVNKTFYLWLDLTN